MKKLLSVALALVVLMSLACTASAMTAGTYTETVMAMHGPMTMEMTVSEDKIESVTVTDHVETPGVGDIAVEQIPAAIVAEQTVAVDAVSGVFPGAAEGLPGPGRDGGCVCPRGPERRQPAGGAGRAAGPDRFCRCPHRAL